MNPTQPIPNPSGLPDVKLEAFEGPLDLLLHLIKVNELDIYDIPIARILEQYLTYLNQMEKFNLEVGGEFLVMASTLMYIKSKLLLPKPPVMEDGTEPEDPRQILVEQLLAYQKFKELAGILRHYEEEEKQFFPRASINEAEQELGSEEITFKAGVADLLTAMQEILTRIPEGDTLSITVEKVSLHEKMSYILDRLQATGRVTLLELATPFRHRIEVIVTFLALLELVKMRAIDVLQTEPFGEILITGIGETPGS